MPPRIWKSRHILYLWRSSDAKEDFLSPFYLLLDGKSVPSSEIENSGISLSPTHTHQCLDRPPKKSKLSQFHLFWHRLQPLSVPLLSLFISFNVSPEEFFPLSIAIAGYRIALLEVRMREGDPSSSTKKGRKGVVILRSNDRRETESEGGEGEREMKLGLL